MRRGGFGALALLSAAGIAAAAAGAAGGSAGALAAGRHAAARPAAAWPTFVPDIAARRFVSTGVPTTATCERLYHIACYSPLQYQRAYHLGPLFARGIDGRGRTIVIVDSFGSPTIRHDLAVFDRVFHLPAPPSLRIIQPAGRVPRYNPRNGTMVGWAGETTLDVEYSHTVAPGANILLVETPTAETEGTVGFPAIIQAENYVVAHHLGDVITQSFGATEQTFPTAQSLLRLRSAYIAAARRHISVLASSGDSGAANVKFNGATYYLFRTVGWPDSDPLVTAVGGTQLHLDAAGRHTAPDSTWNDTYNVATNEFIFGDRGPNPLASGGGDSVIFARPGYQNAVAAVTGPHRGQPDISMSAACNGSSINYSSFGGAPVGFSEVCGTSQASPMFAGIVALADQLAGHDLGLVNPALYRLEAAGAPGIVDITRGGNTVSFPQGGRLHTVPGFAAVGGYDLATGVGTVDAARFVPELAAAG